MDHVRLYPTRLEPARQPEAVAAGFEGQCNPRDLFTGPDRLIPPAMQQGKQPFWARLQLLARLTLNAGKHTANQPFSTSACLAAPESPPEGEGFETSVPVRDSIFSRPPRNLARRTGPVARAGF